MFNESPLRCSFPKISVSWLFGGLTVFLISLYALTGSKNIATINQNDFFLAFDSLLDQKPIDVNPYYGFTEAAFVWAYRDSDSKPTSERNFSWLYLWAHTKIQRLFGIHFHLLAMAALSKLIILCCCYRLAVVCCQRFLHHSAIALIYLVLVMTVFASHNIAFVNSFYGEHTLFVFLPVLLAGLFDDKPWRRTLLILVGTVFCCAAKPQYFYLPLLIAIVLAGFSLAEKKRPEAALLALLAMEFMVGLFYAFHAGGNAANFYNSTYFGSYLLLPDHQLSDLGVKSQNLDCIGVDPWGNRIERHDSVKLTQGPQGCAQRTSISLRAVLAPYWKRPALLIDLWRLAAPSHFTVKYFHVYPDTKYIIPADGKSFHNGRVLIGLTDLRERFITPLYWAIILIGLILPFLSYRISIDRDVKVATMILAVFIPSQFAASLLGEGVRDLSKHLAGAQYCLDLLCLLIAGQFSAYAYVLVRNMSNRSAVEEKPVTAQMKPMPRNLVAYGLFEAG